MPLGGALIAGGAALGGALISSHGAKKAAAAQSQALAAALAFQKQQVELAVNELQAVGIPTVEAQKIVLQNPQLAGLEEIIELPKSEINKIEKDAGLSMQQRQALESLSDLGEAGLTPEEKAERRTMMRSIAAQAESRDKSITQEMQERGMAGSGIELAQRLAASQAGAERAAQETSDLSAQANKRALEAMASSGQLAGQIRSQDYQEALNKAQAQDVINQFNVQQRSDVQQRNLARQQALLDEKTALANQQEMYNKQLLQQQYQNQLAKAQAIASARTGGAQMIGSTMSKQADPYASYQQAKYGAIGQALGGMGSALGGYLSSTGGSSASSTPKANIAYNYKPSSGTAIG